MVNKKYIFVCGVVMAVIGFAIYCNSSNPAGSTTPNLIGVWTGATSRTGGGGCVKDDAGECVKNASGDTVWNYDSMGVVLAISNSGYTITRGNKTWGSSNYGRDSVKQSGTWTSSGGSAIFTPTDSCFIWPGVGCIDCWQKCSGSVNPPNFLDCLPPDTLKININGNTWTTSIVNSKLTKYQAITLVRQ
jgi:hypothetical protein